MTTLYTDQVQKILSAKLIDDTLYEDKSLNIDRTCDLLRAVYSENHKFLTVTHIPDTRNNARYVENYLDYALDEFCKNKNKSVILISAIIPNKSLSKIRKELNL